MLSRCDYDEHLFKKNIEKIVNLQNVRNSKSVNKLLTVHYNDLLILFYFSYVYEYLLILTDCKRNYWKFIYFRRPFLKSKTRDDKSSLMQVNLN